MFDPNKNSGDWATYVPNRSPKFKIHARLGLATSALKNQSHYGNGDSHIIPDECLLFEKIGSQWVERPYKHTYDKQNKSIVCVPLSTYLVQKGCKIPVEVIAINKPINIPKDAKGTVTQLDDTTYTIKWSNGKIENFIVGGGVSCDLMVE